MKICKHGTRLGEIETTDDPSKMKVTEVECSEVNCTLSRSCACDIPNGKQCLFHFNPDSHVLRKALGS